MNPRFLLSGLAVALVAVSTTAAAPPTAAEAAAARSAAPEQLVPPGLLEGTPFQIDEMSRSALKEVEGSPVVLREAIATALARNPEIREQLLGPVVSEAELEARKGVYALSLFADASAAQSVTPQASALAGADNIDLRTQKFGAGLEQPIELSGGSVRVGIENQIDQTNSSYASLSPAYVPTLALELRQPLLRDLLIDRSRAQIKLAEIDRTQSNLTLTQSVRDVVRVVEQDYWQLHLAMQLVRINRLALELGNTLLANDRRRFEVGVLPRPDLLDDEASVARLEDDLVRTRSSIRMASDQLRRDLGLPLSGPALLAADLPTQNVPEIGEVDVLVGQALASREELERGSNVIVQRSVEAEAAENDRLPALDLTAGAGLTGLAGSGRPTSFGGEIFESPFKGSFPDSYDSLGTGDYYDWSVGLELRIPLTSDTADYEAQVANVNRRIAERSLARARQDVELEVRRAHDDATTAALRIGTSAVALDRARDNLESEAKRYTLGASRTDDVIRKIEDYARALATICKAQADHRIAIAALERAAASNLEAIGIRVPTGDEPERPSPEDIGAGKAEPLEPRIDAAPVPEVAPAKANPSP